MALSRCIASVTVLFSLASFSLAQDVIIREQLTDMNQVKDALLEGYPLRFFADYTKCSRTPVITIPGVDIEEPSDFGTVIDTFRGLRDVTGLPIQMTFTTTEIILFPGIVEHVIVHNNVLALPDGHITVTTKYIERNNVTEVATAINDCMLNDGSNDEGVFIYKSSLFEPVAITSYDEMEQAFMDGYSIRYGASFTQCGEFNTGTDTIGGGLIPLYYLKRGERIIASLVKFYNSPFALDKYVIETFKIDIYQNLTMHVETSTINFDNFRQRYTQEVFDCPLVSQSSNPPAIVYKLVPKTMTTATTEANVAPPVPTTKPSSAAVDVRPFTLFIFVSLLSALLCMHH
ncbi:uncharacterized protein [Ptychodera flava]|uniref:uncharacterized protein n=1 Tax=Ptychodera flava TaxID=63121 RepID=UPI00396A3C5B